MATYFAYGRTKATHPLMSVLCVTNRMARVMEANYAKESATAGVVERVILQRSNAGGVTPAATTEKKNTRSPTPGVAGDQWSTAPTLLGNPLVIVDDGDKPAQRNRWRPVNPSDEIWLTDGEELALDATSVANTSTDYAMTWREEVPGLEDRDIKRRPRKRGYWNYIVHQSEVNAGDTTKPKRQRTTNWYQEMQTRQHRKFNLNALLLTGGGTPTDALAASVAGIGSVTANLKVLRALGASSVGVGSVSASLLDTRLVQASVVGVGTVSGQVKVTRNLSTVVTGVATVTANLTTTTSGVLRSLAASVAGSSSVTAALAVSRRLAAGVSGTATVGAALSTARRLSTTVTGSSVVTATTLKLALALRALVTGASQVTGNMTIFGQLPSFLAETIIQFRRRKRWTQGSGQQNRRRRRRG